MKTILAIITVCIAWGCFIIWFLLNEHKWQPQPEPERIERYEPVEPIMEASREMQNIFPNLKDKKLKGQELSDEFERMNWLGNHVCNILHNREPNIEERKKAFSPTLYSGPSNHMIKLLISGCHNFFRMNDVYITEMTDKINDLYGREEKACYSVGFTQIYIFATQLYCKEITAIDLDWRILWGHFQVMRMLSHQKTIEFSKLQIGWSADHAGQIKEVEPNVSVNTFCYTTDTVKCQAAFNGFHDSGVEKMNLQLAYLHQIKLNPTPHMGFIYTSNAIDPGYTSQKEFDKFIERVRTQMSYLQKVVVAYHSGGNKQFGIYELKRIQPDHISINTICRDDYTWSSSYSTRGTKYTTYLDKISSTPEAPECSK